MADTQKNLPIELKLEWDGASCNSGGTISVTLINRGSSAISVPKDGALGPNALFLAEINLGDYVYPSDGHGFLIAYESGYASQGKMKTLNKGDHQVYKFDLAEGSEDEFAHTYRRLPVEGGKLRVKYALNSASFNPSGANNVFLVDKDLKPDIYSNILSCSKEPGRAG